MITLFVWSGNNAYPKVSHRLYPSASRLPRKFRSRADRRYEVVVSGIGTAPPEVVGAYELCGPFLGRAEHTGKQIRVCSEDYNDMLYLLYMLWRYPGSAATQYYKVRPPLKPQERG